MAASEGRWLPHTANHDFFENNYVVTLNVVEFWNTLTSLLVVYAGQSALLYCCGVYFSKSYPLPPTFWLLGLLPLVIGLGSGAFHGTMQRWGQVLDELPMVWSALIFHWALVDVAGKPVFQLFNALGNPRALTNCFFCIALVLGTVVYFVYDFGVFIAVYATCIAWLAARVCFLVLESEAAQPSPASSPQRRIALQAVTRYIGGFLVFWLPTEVIAAQLRSQCAEGMPRATSDSEALALMCGLRLEEWSMFQFTHAFFHLTSAMGTAAMVQFVAWQHFARVGVPVRIHRCSITLLGMDMVIPTDSDPQDGHGHASGDSEGFKTK